MTYGHNPHRIAGGQRGQHRPGTAASGRRSSRDARCGHHCKSRKDRAARRGQFRGGDAERKNLRRAISSGEVVGCRTSPAEEFRTMDVIPSVDVLQGNAVRLTGGQFTLLTRYGSPEEVVESLELERGSRLHVVDL